MLRKRFANRRPSHVDATLLPDAGPKAAQRRHVFHHDQRQLHHLVAKPAPSQAIRPTHRFAADRSIEFSIVDHQRAWLAAQTRTSDPVTIANGIITFTLDAPSLLAANRKPSLTPFLVTHDVRQPRFQRSPSRRRHPGNFEKNLSTPPILDFALPTFYTPENQVAEHVSPPLSKKSKLL